MSEAEKVEAQEAEFDPRFDTVSRNRILSEHATLQFILAAAYTKLYGDNANIKVMHSLGDGIYMVDSEGYEINQRMVDEITEKMKEIVTDDKPIEIQMVGRTELLRFFQDVGRLDKVGVLKAWQDHFIPCIVYDGFIDYRIEEMCTDKSRLQIFEVRLYDKGLLLRFPTFLTPNKMGEFVDKPVLHAIFKETEEWAGILKADTCADINEAIVTKRIDQIRMINEGLHEKKIAKIAQALCDNFSKKRVITIAGASSSNKTTFAKRLCIQLRVSGFGATLIEMDDYFQDLEQIPQDEKGQRDFEHISAMNVELLGKRVHELLEGKEIPERKYNFKRGQGEDHPTKRLSLPPHNFLILEGIHGLNPELLKHIGQDISTPLYVCALTPIHIDMNHRFTTSDLRLIRRCIRDHNYRGCSVRKTLRMWTSVRVGEERNIFPYHENAAYFFNSALVFEPNVLSIMGRVILSHGTFPDEGEDGDSPDARTISAEAKRLLSVLNLFYPMSPESLSKISTIREFIGGSDLSY